MQPLDAAANPGNLRAAGRRAVRRRGDFAAAGRVSDVVSRDSRHRCTKVLMGRGDQIPTDYQMVIFGLRLPRIAFGIIVGGALAVSGAGFQALLRNPLADPYVLGVSSGAAVGAIVSLIFAPHVPLAMQGAAFAGAGIDDSGGLFSWPARRAN